MTIFNSVLGLMMACAAAGYVIQMPVVSSSWTKEVFLYPHSGITTDQAANLTIVPLTGTGGQSALSVGQWYSGQWGVRWDYNKHFSYTSGTVRGMYRTEDLMPFIAQISIGW